MAARAVATGARALLVVLAAAAGCAQGTPGDAVPTTRGVLQLASSLSPRARPEREIGRMDPGARLEGMSVLLVPSGTKAERDQLLRSLQDPASPLYHRWLTPQQYATRFGANAGDIARVTSWLRDSGFDVLGTAPTGLRVFYSGTVDQVERAFATEMHRYAVGSETHFAMSIAPSVPADLAPVVSGLHGLDDFRPRAKYKPQGSSTYEMSPTDFATIYDLSPLYAAGIDGTGQKIAVAGQTAIYAADVSTFRSTFGLPAAQPTDVLVPYSGNSYVSNMSDLGEAELDVEWSGAVAKNATILFVHTGDNQSYSVFDSVYYAVENSLAPILSLSYGYCEYEATQSEAIFYETMGDVAAMLGISMITSSGDDGPATCDYHGAEGTAGLAVDFPADIPTVTGVGGTDIIAQPTSTYFDGNGYAVSYIPEVGWNDTAASVHNGGGMAASGGGLSRVFAKPYWQTGITPSDGARDVPDVALSASWLTVPYVVVNGGHQVQAGGTSAGAPTFSGILALVNQAIGAAQPGLGNANPVLYALSQSVPGAFHDITMGDDIVPCRGGTPDCPAAPPYQYGYTCGPGYDLVTGLGSLDAANLVNAWKSLIPTTTTLAAAAQGTTEGSPLELDATITSNATGTPMTGNVTFFYYTQYSTGGIDLSASLGTVPLTPVTSPTEGGTATLMTHAPPGLYGQAQVVAVYDGDLHYLASWSALVPVSATSMLAISPANPTVNPGQTVMFTATGGQSPFVWTFGTSTATSTSSIDPTSGLYQASSTGGEQDTILVVDAYGAEALTTVTIAQSGPTDGGGPQDAAGRPDGSGAVDAGAGEGAPPIDGTTSDSGTTSEAGTTPTPRPASPGCSCTAVGARGSSDPMAAWIAAALVACATGRARRPSRTSSRATRPGPRRGW
jgi:Pro-kumamolisin, activation domain